MSLEVERKAVFTKVQRIVSSNVANSSVREQLIENKFITALFLSQLAYFKFETITSKLIEFGATKFAFYNQDGTQGYRAEFNDLVVVAFRGTRSDGDGDLKKGFTFWKEHVGNLDLHKGFYSGVAPIVDEVKTDLSITMGKKHTIYVGHSLGGALATILALLNKPDELCTFGTPRVAGKEIGPLLEGVEYNRIVTRFDWIVKLPPSLPWIRYKHVGKKFVLHCDWHWSDIIHPHKLSTYLDEMLRDERITKR